jgi:hypothetical protein
MRREEIYRRSEKFIGEGEKCKREGYKILKSSHRERKRV